MQGTNLQLPLRNLSLPMSIVTVANDWFETRVSFCSSHEAQICGGGLS